MNITEAHNRAVTATELIIDEIGPEQLNEPTPCEGWKVRDVLNHVVAGTYMMQAAAAGRSFKEAGGSTLDLVGSLPLGIYQTSTASLQQSFAVPGVLEKTLTLPFGEFTGEQVLQFHFLELLVHGWDLAKATEQANDMDPELADYALELAKGFVNDQSRGPNTFGAAIEISSSAPPVDRLLAFLGRKP